MSDEQFDGPLPTTSGAALRLHLSHLRASQLTAAALAAQFPDEESWLAFLGSDVVHATLESFAAFVNDVRFMVDAGVVIDFAQLEAIGAKHLDTGLDAVEDLAATLNLEPQDLLTTLLYG